MGVVPTKTVDRIQFFEDHIAPWTTNAVAIGTTATAVTDLDTKTDAARAAYTAQQVAQQAAKAATTNLINAVNAMSAAGASIIDQVRAKARLAGDSVYGLAQIPIPATPGARQPPGTPSNLVAELDGDGALKLSWKCNNPAGTSGTVYQIWRRIGATGEYTYVGGVGQRKFTDEEIPAGATMLMYKIQAVRSSAIGGWATFVVSFGTNTGTGVTATVLEEPAKLAA